MDKLSNKQVNGIIETISNLIEAWTNLLDARADQAKAAAEHMRILAANDEKHGTTTNA